jgi:glycolate oxidase FAD binding subunit
VPTTQPLPLTDTLTPASQEELAAAVGECARTRTAVYPLGGGTSLDYGLVPKQSGVGLSLEKLNRVVDYPARDMTITVEAGIRLGELTRVLAEERQWLPIEAPASDRATLGGLVATAWCGPRRYGWGTVRDYVIGISAVDGRGMPFKGGGRVVKNVAGYDFCKLLTGSLGTLGVITQVTLKIRPLPATTAFVACPLADWDQAERLLAALVDSAATPSAIELVTGPAWSKIVPTDSSGVGTLLVGLDGSAVEVKWMIERLHAELAALGAVRCETLAADAARPLWDELREFSGRPDAPLVVKASLRSSATVDFVRLVRSIDPQASVQAHAGSGVVIARFNAFTAADVSRTLIGRLQPATVAGGGHVVLLSSAFASDLTRQAVWGGADDATAWMVKVKQQFDPQNLLNPGRFVYGF